MISDGPIAALALLLLAHVPDVALRILQGAGGLLLLFFAAGTFGQWRRGEAADAAPAGPRTLFQAVLVNALNPNPYLGWTLVLGPAAIRAWNEKPGYALALVAGFYGVMAAGLAATTILFGAAHTIGPRWRRSLLLASALLLAAIGAIQLVLALLRLWPRS